MSLPIVGTSYRHYKGGTYIVTALAKSEVDCSPQVVYQTLNKEVPETWVRSLESWNSLTESGEPRFERIERRQPT